MSGIGVLNSSEKKKAASDLVDFLTSPTSQAKFVDQTHEYSLIETVSPATDLPTLAQIGAPSIDLGSLSNIKATQELLIEVGLL